MGGLFTWLLPLLSLVRSICITFTFHTRWYLYKHYSVAWTCQCQSDSNLLLFSIFYYSSARRSLAQRRLWTNSLYLALSYALCNLSANLFLLFCRHYCRHISGKSFRQSTSPRPLSPSSTHRRRTMTKTATNDYALSCRHRCAAALFIFIIITLTLSRICDYICCYCCCCARCVAVLVPTFHMAAGVTVTVCGINDVYMKFTIPDRPKHNKM